MTSKGEWGHLPHVRLWGLNALFWSHLKLFVKEIQNLPEFPDHKGVYYYATKHPVTRVEIVGYIVSIDAKEKLTIYGVDDGSGTLQCCRWHQPDGSMDNEREVLNLGQLVTVQGKISVYREQQQLTVDLIHAESDPNTETLLWLEAVNLGNTVYSETFSPLLKEFQAGEAGLSKETQLKQAILLHIRENNMVAFQFKTLCIEPDILQLATDAVRKRPTEELQGKKLDGPYEAKKVIRQVIKDLEREGLVYFKDSTTDLYQVISHELNLGPAVLKTMEKISVPSGTPVSKWAIIDVLHSSHKFHFITLLQLEESLDKLLQSSHVYRHSENEYCLV
ncbi:CST complex subunit STN1-like [Montipora foliosa]|uniref:CST complex subunit STN1-like n=1 Tax=Montipora foliosa TaxID=591990 RepID=UPI0035F124EA